MAPRPSQEGSWGGLGPLLGALWPSLEGLGGLLGRLEGVLDCSSALFGRSWAVLLDLWEVVLDHFGVRFIDSINRFDSMMRFVDSIR